MKEQARVMAMLRENCQKMGMIFDEKGYVSEPEDNLLQHFNNWIEIEKEIKKGDGRELSRNAKSGRRSFCAIHSSACLCVNSFAQIKNNIRRFKFLKLSDFSVAIFEKKLTTGISTPNLDFYLENKTHSIGIESKFTEYLQPKLPDSLKKDNKTGLKYGNLTHYINRFEELSNVPSGFRESVFEYYIQKKEKLYLDVAQLIKHTLGLLNRQAETGLKAVLVYIYWEPETTAGVALYAQHRKEIEEFRTRIGTFVDFEAMSYKEFWETNNVALGAEEVGKLRKRYGV